MKNLFLTYIKIILTSKNIQRHVNLTQMSQTMKTDVKKGKKKSGEWRASP